ncbi:MAG: hypothetical protein EB084_20295, partial [Proteobacteria bacterium]|nr:hypothetical protein [Pseudomonadota bacterium]
ANGVYSSRDIDREQGLTHSLADGKQISDSDRQRRNADGIWPNKADITRKDGRRIEAQLEGSRLNGLSETFPASGDSAARQVKWNRDGSGQWQSDEQPPRIRKSMDLMPDGGLRYVDEKNQRVIEHTDGRREITADGVTRAFGADNAITRVTLADGRSRSFDYKDGKLSSITDTDKAGRQTWTREGDSNDFTTPGVDHKRQVMGKPHEDGSYGYVACNGDTCEQKTAPVGEARENAGVKGVDGKPVDGLVGPGTDNKINPQPPVDTNLPADAVAAQQAFLDSAKQAGLDSKRLDGYMADFAENAKKYGYSADQIVRTFNNLNTLLTSPEKSPLYTPEQRKNLVETAMHNIARPTEIDQGYHPTCNVTTLEIYSAARHPEEYSRLVKEIGLTGSWKTSDGKTVTPPANALKPGDDETNYDLDKPSSGKRNFASQVMEMTLINGTYQTGGKGDKWKDRSYVMDKISWQREGAGSVKIGEDRIADRNGRPISNKDSGPDFSQDDIVTASKMMLGKENPMPYLGAPYSTNGGRTWNYDLPSTNRLMDLKANGSFPLGVSTMGGAHVQTIHDVKVGQDGKTYVKLDNQHGAKHDGWVTLPDLHRTMRTGVELTPAIPFDKVPD